MSEPTAPESTDARPATGLWGRFRALPNDSREKTLLVALILCLVCSVIVASAAVTLRPLQVANADLDRKRNILEVAGLMRDGGDVETLFEAIESRIVDLRTGEYTEAVDPANYDARQAARDPASSQALANTADIAQIGRRAHYAQVFLVRDQGRLSRLVLPVHGYGLWSTLYGFLALDGSLDQVYGLQFYEHAETPGLGGEVDNPNWRAQWRGKEVFDDAMQLRLEVVKGRVTPGPNQRYQVDGLAGATLTSRGVSNMLQFWLSESGFGPYLQRLRSEMQ